MSLLRRTQLVFAVVAVALAVRLYNLNITYLEPYNNVTRQTVVAMIIRNFYHNGFHFMYPEIDLNGNGPSLYNAEMPVYSYLMALLYRWTGGIHEWAARAVSVFFSMGTLFFLYRLLKRIADSRLALFALFFAALSPLNVALSRSIQPDTTSLFASMGALSMFYDYCLTNRKRFLVISALFFWLAIASKVYALYLAVPLLALAWETQGARAFSDIKNYIYAAISLSALFWYVYMWQQGQTQALYYSTIDYNRGPAYHHVWELFSSHYLLRFIKVFFIHVLTLPGLVLFLAGFVPSFRDKNENFFYIWFASVFLYLVIFWRISIDHSYYQLPFVPVVSYFVARGAQRILDHSWWRVLPGKKVWVSIFWACVLGSTLYFYRGLYFLPDRLKAVVHAGALVRELTPKDSLVIAAFETGPAQLYYCDRKGWEFNIRNNDETELIRDFDSLKKKGASFFVTADRDVLKTCTRFNQYLRDRFKILKETDEFVIFRLV